MKIIGFIATCPQGDKVTYQMVLKGDSCLLVNRKPFFTPDWTQDLRMTPCIVVRVSRLGKEIAAKFAPRYYDAVANGIDFVAWDKMQAAQQEGKSWTEAIAFDYSLAVGTWLTPNLTPEQEQQIHQAIAQASRVMTIRQGDLIYIQQGREPVPVKRDEVIEQEGLYCKIK